MRPCLMFGEDYDASQVTYGMMFSQLLRCVPTLLRGISYLVEHELRPRLFRDMEGC